MCGRWQKRCLVVVLALGPAVLSQACAGEPEAKVRPISRPGFWFPNDPAVLTKTVDDALDRAAPPELTGKPIALIEPHAGYRVAAPVMATGYRCLRGHTYTRVIVLAFSHANSWRYDGVEVPADLAAYETPLGPVPIDRDICVRLLKHPLFLSNPDIGRGEHSLENQLPFLQRALGEFHLVPLLVGRMSDRDCAEAAKAILPLLDENTLLVASSDFTHYGAYFHYTPFTKDIPENIRKLADQAAEPIVQCDYDGFVAHLDKTKDTICGAKPITLLLRILSMRGGAKGIRTGFDTSGRILKDWTSSVTYQSFAFAARPENLSKQERTDLLRLARQTATAFLNEKQPPTVDEDKLPAALRADGACFVTLKNHGRLRGCIGNMVAQEPLYQAVIHNARSACTDSRFVVNPVTAQELDELHIEISYLTPMKRVENVNDIVIGRHGLLISLHGYRGVLLPQVPYELGWTREEFLKQTCRKAGLPPDAWKEPKAELYSFEAEVFGEPE